MAKFVKAERDLTNVDEELKKLEATKKTKKQKAESTKAKAKKGKTTKKDTKKKTKKQGKVITFFKEVKSEVSKVKWPSKKDMVKYSIATIVFVIFFALFFYLIDLIIALLKAGA